MGDSFFFLLSFSSLPRESLLAELDRAVVLAIPHRQTNLIAERAGPAHGDAHGADLVLHLGANEVLDVGAAWEHLHRRRGGVDLLGRARPRHKQHDPQALAPPVHGQDLGHPRPDPLEVLGRLDDPHQQDLARRHRAVGVADHQVAHVRHGLRDAHAAGKEHHCAVRVHIVQGAIGTLHEAGGDHTAVGTGGGLLVQRAREARAGTNHVGHARLAQAEDVVAVHGELLAVVHLRILAPANGEGVGLRPADAGEVQVGVLAGCECPGPCHGDGDAAGVAGEGLDNGLGAAGANVAVRDAHCTGSTVEGPEGDHGVQVVELDKVLHLTVVPDTGQRDGGACDVEDLEDLVPGVPQNADGVEHHKSEADGADEAV